MKVFVDLLTILITSSLINNVILSQFLGICPFLGVSRKVSTAVGMGGALTFVVTLSSFVCGVLNVFFLEPETTLLRFYNKETGAVEGLDLTYLQTIVFILIIAMLVQFVEMFLKKFVVGLYQALGVYLPLITTNCCVLGVALLNVQNDYNVLYGTVNGFATALGFTIAITLMAGIREKMSYNDIPLSFKGMPIVLISASLMAIAFTGFSGLK